jgi:hypothetical protein
MSALRLISASRAGSCADLVRMRASAVDTAFPS